MSGSPEGVRNRHVANRDDSNAERIVRQPGRHGAQLAAVFLLGCLLFNYPLMSVFSVEGRIFGVPVLFAYLFGAWATLIALVALVTEQRRR